MKKTFRVEQVIEVEVDESKFTPEFMREFSEGIHPFDSVQEHMEYIAELVATGVVMSRLQEIEGYGVLKDMGIRFSLKEGPNTEEDY